MTENQGEKMTVDTDPNVIQIIVQLSDSIVKIIMNIWENWRKLGNLSRDLKSLKERIKLNIGIKKYSVWNLQFVRLFPWIRQSKPGFVNRKTGQYNVTILMQRRKMENMEKMWRAIWNWINSEQEFSKWRKVFKNTVSRSFMNSKQEDLYWGQTILRHIIIKLIKDYKNLKRQKGNNGVKKIILKGATIILMDYFSTEMMGVRW